MLIELREPLRRHPSIVSPRLARISHLRTPLHVVSLSVSTSYNCRINTIQTTIESWIISLVKKRSPKALIQCLPVSFVWWVHHDRDTAMNDTAWQYKGSIPRCVYLSIMLNTLCCRNVSFAGRWCLWMVLHTICLWQELHTKATMDTQRASLYDRRSAAFKNTNSIRCNGI